MKLKTGIVLLGAIIIMALLLKVQAAYEDTDKDQTSKVAAEQSAGQKSPSSEQNALSLGNAQWSPPMSFASLAKMLKPAVVNISTSKVIKNHPPIDEKMPKKEHREWKSDPFWEQFDKFFGSQPRKFKSRSLGSGFIIDPDGYIITNNHVIEETDEIIVQTSDQKELKATIVGRDAKTDVALIKVEAKEPLPTVKLADSDKLEVGDWVLAIGNPFGFEHSVTAGIVSAKGRLLGGSPYEDFIQTDASINPGNSGGPLFNMQGEVVGINSAIINSAQGLGFAISINSAKDLIPQLREKGKIVRAWLGINLQEVTEDIAGSFALDKTKGVLISNVIKGTPAEKYGLQRGDIILEFNGQTITEIRALQKLVAASPVGVEQTLKLLRDGQEKLVSIKLEEMRDKIKEQPPREVKWGIVVQEITPEIAKGLGIGEEKGMIISEVKENSVADKAGIRRGDIILEINRKSIKTLEEYHRKLDELKEGDYCLLLVKRGENTNYLAFKISETVKK